MSFRLARVQYVWSGFYNPPTRGSNVLFSSEWEGLLTVGHARTWGKQGRIHKGTVNILWENDSNAFLFIQYKSYCAGDV